MDFKAIQNPVTVRKCEYMVIDPGYITDFVMGKRGSQRSKFVVAKRSVVVSKRGAREKLVRCVVAAWSNTARNHGLA